MKEGLSGLTTISVALLLMALVSFSYLGYSQTVNSVVFDPSNPFTTDDVTANITVDSLETTSMVYTWWKNGVLNRTTGSINDAGLTFWLPFDNDAKDYKGTNDGTAYGNSYIDKTNFKIGTGAYNFDGSGDYIKYSDSSNVQLKNNFTLEVWVRPNVDLNSGSGWNFFIDKSKGASPNKGYGLGYKQGEIRFRVYGTSEIQIAYTTDLSANTWYHIVATNSYEDGQKIYLNGDLVKSSATIVNVTNYADELCISGYSYDDCDLNFNGIIDEVRIYKRVLTPEEIHMHYEAGKMTYSNVSSTLEQVVLPSSETATGDTWTLEVIPVSSTNIGSAVNGSVTIGTADTCTYSGTGDWVIKDNCTISGDVINVCPYITNITTGGSLILNNSAVLNTSQVILYPEKPNIEFKLLVANNGVVVIC